MPRFYWRRDVFLAQGLIICQVVSCQLYPYAPWRQRRFVWIRLYTTNDEMKRQTRVSCDPSVQQVVISPIRVFVQGWHEAIVVSRRNRKIILTSSLWFEYCIITVSLVDNPHFYPSFRRSYNKIIIQISLDVTV